MGGREGWTEMLKTSESSSIPSWMDCQVAPPSMVRHGRCVVPAYRTSLCTGSKARATTGLNSAFSSGEMRRQLSPPSRLRKMPSAPPAAITCGLISQMASDQMAFPLSPASRVQDAPPSTVRYRPEFHAMSLSMPTYQDLPELIYFGQPNSLTIPGVGTRAFQDVKDNYFGSQDKDARELVFHYA